MSNSDTQARETKIRGEHNGREWSITPSTKGESDLYPQTDAYTWGAFAGLAIELGGYGDLEAVDPYSGRRFWLADAFKPAEGNDEDVSIYEALRRLADAMDAAGFLTPVNEAPVSRT